jgi:hypothetical protein
MTEQEAEHIYVQLSEYLPKVALPDEQRSGFPTAIQAEIEAGKPVQIRLKVRPDQLIKDPVVGMRSAGSADSGSRAEFIQRQEFTPKEKLELMVDGLGLARVAPPLMARRIFETIRRVNPVAASEVRLSDDRSDVEPKVFRAQEVEEAVGAVGKLQEILFQLKRELRHPTGAREG